MFKEIKQWYLSFLEKGAKAIPEKVFFGFLYLLSLVYGFGVNFKNFLYGSGVFRPYACRAKVISIGNLCWSGSGKTTLSLRLYKELSLELKTAILRRGYGNDEGKLLKEGAADVFSSPDRRKLAKKLESRFDVFILDDGFGHRKLGRDIDIVIMGAREFKNKYNLIPASFFREPLNSLKRADIVMLNYASRLKDIQRVKSIISKTAPRVKIYCCDYKVKGFRDLDGEKVEAGLLKERKIAAFCAIGYPEGFFNKLEETGLKISRRIAYPDHYELNEKELAGLKDSLLKEGIENLVITRKDKYHLPAEVPGLNIFIMDIEIEIKDAEGFIREIKGRLV